MGTDEGSGGPPAGSDLQFDKVEHAAPAAPPTCRRCQRVIDDEYFEVVGHLFCRPCVRAIDAGNGATAFLRALGLGTGAALIGTLAWYAVIRFLNMELGLLAIGVGFLVGFAVRKGARGLGGWQYQALAMALTYISITINYLDDSTGEGIVAFVEALAAPFRAGASNIMGLIIIAIALYEAWKINKRVPIAGPFRLGAPPVDLGAPGPPPATSPT